MFSLMHHSTFQVGHNTKVLAQIDNKNENNIFCFKFNFAQNRQFSVLFLSSFLRSLTHNFINESWPTIPIFTH